ncbi:hypothetical protein O6H91_17G039700 [Diphasiastrum complanatum]|uniref:Uncharacterized protein n=1 Tax=Diphasiastrum complanatum TaxID=34168 RepID=A0ACC2B5Y4_DIPCM|nr:hypothetical protein O6H91_17G039700 [Diphasiastrum complanatum]
MRMTHMGSSFEKKKHTYPSEESDSNSLSESSLSLDSNSSSEDKRSECGTGCSKDRTKSEDTRKTDHKQKNIWKVSDLSKKFHELKVQLLQPKNEKIDYHHRQIECLVYKT